MELEQKSLRLELKAGDDAEGSFSATFATLGVVDHHGDVTLPGAFETRKEVLVGAYMHDIFSLPVGKGVIRADEERAWIEGAFWLETGPGGDTYRTVKNAGGLMEWSYVFQVLEADHGPFDTGKGTVDVRFLKKLDVWSVDPVLKGAGVGTRTDSIKGLSRGLTFTDHADGIAGEAEAFLARVKERLAVRTKEGRQLSAANVEKLGSIAESLKAAAASLEKLLAEANPPKADLQRELLSYQRTLAQLEGVFAA